jgi:hypothetical protein
VRSYFLDSSAVAKLYLIEPGSKRVRDMVRSARSSPSSTQVYICDLAHPEAASALRQIADGPDASKRGIGSLERKTLPLALANDLHSGGVLIVGESSQVMLAAAALVWKHRLKGADAVHLAAAMEFQALLPWGTEFYFVGADKQQNAAAEAEGLEVIDPNV